MKRNADGLAEDEGDGKARHPIGVVAERTGLSQEVLRVWERRYGVVEPTRAPGGQRLYSDADVQRLRLLHQATQGGRQIGRVVDLSMDELSRLVRDDEAERFAPPVSGGEVAGDMDLEEALGYTRALDAERLEGVLRWSATLSGAPRFLERTVASFLSRVGDEWHRGRLSVAQEHMATAVVERVVTSVLGSLRHPAEAPVLLVASPVGDRHELGALLAAATAAAEGWRVVYLGSDLPAEEIVEAAKASAADVVGLSVVFVEDRARTLAELNTVRKQLSPSIPLLVGGGAAADLGRDLKEPGTRVVGDLEALREALRASANRSDR